jgi:hypothetical protein
MFFTKERCVGVRWATPIAVAVLAAACTPNPPAPAAHESAQPRSSVSKHSRAEIAGTLAIEVYLGMWRSMATAARTSDWQSELLSRFATGYALTTLSRGLYADHQNGLITLGEPKNSPSVAGYEPAADPTTVRIADCGDSTNWLKYHADTRQPANDGPGGRRAISAVVTKQAGGRWMVSDFAVREVGTC